VFNFYKISFLQYIARRIATSVVLFALCAVAAHGDESSLVVITNVASPVQQISLPEVRLIFSGRKQVWSDGSVIHVVLLNTNSATHQLFVKDVFGVWPHQLDRAWSRAVFSGRSTPPIIVETEAQMIMLVGTIPGAIGYIFDPTKVVSNPNIGRIWP